MNIKKALIRTNQIALLTASLGVAASSNAADQELLDILLSNGAIDQSQYDALMQRETLNSTDILPDTSTEIISSPAVAAEVSRQIE
ncbi:hypothetical protein N9390_09400, partial [Gammaproteobacteria bacterium]|nr:hypothetical protein [Gammaproteobacteria bacterium]